MDGDRRADRTGVQRLGLRQDIGTALRRGPRTWRDVATATWELARGNIEMRHTSPDRLRLLEQGGGGTGQVLSPHQHALVERVSHSVQAMGLRVPWRSDCLVQALAARRWLARGGVASDLCLGVRKGADGFGAHAWLKVGERIVTGGEIASYAELPPVRRPGGAARP